MERKEYIKPTLKRLEEVLTQEEEGWRKYSYDYINFALLDITLYKIHKSSESLKWGIYI